jgi:hypothetical protein
LAEIEDALAFSIHGLPSQGMVLSFWGVGASVNGLGRMSGHPSPSKRFSDLLDTLADK